ncbi:MAG: UDP-3-O-(3-hydroxymyristoyl)glucosamine N-acyltransferase [Lentisphaeria bacterium]
MTKRQFTAKELTEELGGILEGDPSVVITGVESLDAATPGQLSFLGNSKYTKQVVSSEAGAVLVPQNFSEPPPTGRAWIRCDDPSAAFTRAVQFFAPPPVKLASRGVHPAAAVAEDACIAEDAAIGAHAVIERGVCIGANSVVGPGCYIGHETSIGDNCVIHPNVTIRERCQLGNKVIIHSGTVIGSDGFGYIPGREQHTKIPQVGIVRIDDDVEIGAQVAIDRARFGRTWVKKGAKIDNLVQIAHNVVIGELSFVVAQVGISGSTEIGKRVSLAGQAGLAGHITIGDDSIVMAQSGLNKDLPAGSSVLGSPAKDRREYARDLFSVGRIPKLTKQIKGLQKELEDIKKQLAQSAAPETDRDS